MVSFCTKTSLTRDPPKKNAGFLQGLDRRLGGSPFGFAKTPRFCAVRASGSTRPKKKRAICCARGDWGCQRQPSGDGTLAPETRAPTATAASAFRYRTQGMWLGEGGGEVKYPLQSRIRVLSLPRRPYDGCMGKAKQLGRVLEVVEARV